MCGDGLATVRLSPGLNYKLVAGRTLVNVHVMAPWLNWNPNREDSDNNIWFRIRQLTLFLDLIGPEVAVESLQCLQELWALPIRE